MEKGIKKMSRSEMKMKLILDYVFWIYKEEEGGNTREISHKWHETRVEVFPNELLDSTSKKKSAKTSSIYVRLDMFSSVVFPKMESSIQPCHRNLSSIVFWHVFASISGLGQSH